MFQLLSQCSPTLWNILTKNYLSHKLHIINYNSKKYIYQKIIKYNKLPIHILVSSIY